MRAKFRKLRNLLVRLQVRCITRQRLMRTLDRHFEEAGVQLTVRRYNEILQALGYDLEY